MNTSINIAGLTWKNPVTTASGTFASGQEYADFVDLNALGAVTTKGVSSVPWTGNPTPRICETPAGMMNAIGLQNPGVDVFIARDLPYLAQFDTNVVVNVCGHSIEEYVDVVEKLSDQSGVHMLEINVSCPNVKEGGMAFGTDPEMLAKVTREVKAKAKQPISIKLSPNVTDIALMAKAAEDAGADAISMINTFQAMRIDVVNRRFVLANKTGGLSGPAIHPIAVRMVYDVHKAVKIPIIAMGGIADGYDAIEFLLAGATAVAVGVSNFRYPKVTRQVIREMTDYMETFGVTDINELIGGVIDDE